MSYLRSLEPDAGLLQIFQEFPEVARPLLEYHEVLLRGGSPFSAAERELIAAYVSALNNCNYCRAVHSQTGLALGIGAETIAGISSNPQHSDVPLRLRPVLAFRAQADALARQDHGRRCRTNLCRRLERSR